MQFTSSGPKADSETSQTQSFSRMNIFAALAFAATLALAPLPTLAQHGGGGGGGAHGGGGGGGSHGGGVGGGGSHAAPSSGTHAANSSAGSSATNNSTGASHWWNPFHGSGTNASGSNTGSNADHVSTERFAGGNNTWQEPPAAGVHDAAAANAGRGSAATPRAAIASPPHVPVPRHPVGGGPFYPFYPYGGFGYGFGYGGLGFGYGAFGPCDPFWGGCNGFGYGGGGIGYGYYGGGYGGYSSDDGYSGDLNYSGSQDTTPPQDTYAWAPETSQGAQSATNGPMEKPVTAVLYFKDGSSYAVTNYWLADGKLHYLTSYGGENAVDQKDLDLQKTVDENAAQGLTFTLRPGPVVSGGAVVVPQ